MRRIHMTSLVYLFLVMSALFYLSLNPTAIVQTSKTISNLKAEDKRKVVVMMCDDDLAACMPNLNPALKLERPVRM